MLDLNRVCMVELDVYMNTRNITTTITTTTQNIRNEKYKRIKFKIQKKNETRRQRSKTTNEISNNITRSQVEVSGIVAANRFSTVLTISHIYIPICIKVSSCRYIYILCI